MNLEEETLINYNDSFYVIRSYEKLRYVIKECISEGLTQTDLLSAAGTPAVFIGKQRRDSL